MTGKNVLRSAEKAQNLVNRKHAGNKKTPEIVDFAYFTESIEEAAKAGKF